MGEFFGRYELTRRLAFGGMAEIFLAVLRRDEGFSKKVVLKRILPQFGSDAEFVRMFIDEAVLAARLSHPNIVQVHDFGNVDGVYFIAMEFVEGADLRRLLRLAADAHRTLSLAEVATIGEGVARGLAHAHAAADDRGQQLGIVHRDVSPHNIMISRTGEAKIMDFGIAKVVAKARQTAAGTIKGKVAYMAPEQAAGRPLDARADQFSLGVVLWECLSGRRLFLGDSDLEILRRVAHGEVEPIQKTRPDVSESLAGLIMRMLARVPQDRFPDLPAVQDELANFRVSLGREGVIRLDALVNELVPPESVIASPSPPRPTKMLEPADSGVSGSETEIPTASDREEQQPGIGPARPDLAAETISPALTEERPIQVSRWARRRVLSWVAAASVFVLLFSAALAWRQIGRHPDKLARPLAAGPPQSTLQVVSQPPGARILIDSADTGLRTPAALPAPASGPFDLRLELDGYRPFRKSVGLTGKGDAVSALLEPIRLSESPAISPVGAAKVNDPTARSPTATAEGGWLSLRSSGMWFNVFLGRKKLGETPIKRVAVPAGRLVLRLINPETGAERQLAVVIPAGEEVRRTVSFDAEK